MTGETHRPVDFYATARGAIVARLLRARLAALWPAVRGQSILAIGYGAPYLRLWREEASRCIALAPAQASHTRWPSRAPNLSCAAEEDRLPFSDLCFDRILLIHGLEVADNTRRLLREVWRVLKDDGHLLIVAPNRRGWWAHVETTPFGHGQPFSAGQIERLLAASLFRVERRDTALYLPPTNLRPVLRSANLLEQAGRALLPQFAGVTVTEAVKDMYAAMPLREPRRRLVLAKAA